MGSTAKRVVAGLLVLIGTILSLGGLWLTSQLGTSGTATFTTKPAANGAIILPPSILNRVDAPVTVRVVAQSPSAQVWIGRARPSDANAAIGSSPKQTVTAVKVSGWDLALRSAGSGQVASFSKADLWHEQAAGQGSAQVTVSQADAPETVVATVSEGSAKELSVSYERKAWFVQSVIAALVGLFLILAGLLTWRLRRPGSSPQAASAPAVPTPSEDEAAPAGSSRTAFPASEATTKENS